MTKKIRKRAREKKRHYVREKAEEESGKKGEGR